MDAVGSLDAAQGSAYYGKIRGSRTTGMGQKSKTMASSTISIAQQDIEKPIGPRAWSPVLPVGHRGVHLS